MTSAATVPLRQLLLQAWRRRFAFWVARRIPAARNVRLGHRNIFILPNRQGLGLLLVLALMFIGAINYQISLAFALVFLLLGMGVLTIFHTFRNLHGLHLAAVAGGPVFAGDQAEFVVILNRLGSRRYENVQVSFADSRPQTCDLLDQREARLSLFVPVTRRGWQSPGRLVVETVFPFGLCRAWSLLDLDCRTLVYPRPVACDLDWLLQHQSHNGSTTPVRGSDDFDALRDYRAGDSLKHVAWKILARGQGMYTKQYISAIDEKLWLRWEMFEGLGTEQRLSRLCWCTLQLDSAGIEYGLDIPGTRLAPARGAAHYASVLRTLALFADPATRPR